MMDVGRHNPWAPLRVEVSSGAVRSLAWVASFDVMLRSAMRRFEV
jgi:hypothetical protein